MQKTIVGKALSLFLVLVLVFSALPISAFAATLVITNVSSTGASYFSAMYYQNGKSYILIEGNNLVLGEVTVIAFESDRNNPEVVATAGSTGQYYDNSVNQSVVLDFPTNNSPTNDIEYTVAASCDGGITWFDFAYKVKVNNSSKPPREPNSVDFPTGPAAEQTGISSAVFKWGTPRYDGGSPITGYQVAVTTDPDLGISPNNLNWINTSGLSYTFTNLTLGETYQFYARAVNAYGASNLYSTGLTITDVPASDEEKVAAGKNDLTFDNIRGSNAAENLIISNLISYVGDVYGNTISYHSSNPSVITDNGYITRPAMGQSDVDVDFTATIAQGSASDTKVFNLTVKALQPIYTVTFETNGGSSIAPVSVEKGFPITPPAAPAKSGYTFGGWYEQNDLQNAWNFTDYTVIQNITLYAKWIENNNNNNGNNNNSGSSGGSSSSNSANSNTSSPATQTSSNVSSNGSVSSAAISSDLTTALATTSAGGTAKLSIKNAQSISGSTLASLAKSAEKAGKSAVLQADTVGADGSVQARLYIDPANFATLDTQLQLTANTTGAKVENREKQFEKFFDNKVSVVSFAQKGTFGAPVKVAVKIELPKDTSNLVFYSYDPATNKYTQIETTYTIDKNGYVHFTTTMANDIIISDGKLKRK